MSFPLARVWGFDTGQYLQYYAQRKAPICLWMKFYAARAQEHADRAPPLSWAKEQGWVLRQAGLAFVSAQCQNKPRKMES
jgi:hypothetical protein